MLLPVTMKKKNIFQYKYQDSSYAILKMKPTIFMSILDMRNQINLANVLG